MKTTNQNRNGARENEKLFIQQPLYSLKVRNHDEDAETRNLLWSKKEVKTQLQPLITT